MACRITRDELRIMTENFAKTLEPAEKRFFDAWMLGSLYSQKGALKTLTNRLNETARAENWSEKDRLAELEKIKKDYWRTNYNQFGFGLDVVDPLSVKEYGQRYNEIIQAATKTELDENDVRDILNRSRVDEFASLAEVMGNGAHGLNDATKIDDFVDTFTSRVWQIDEDAERAQIFDGKKGQENLQRVQELKSIFRRNPTLMRHYSDLFISTTSKINEARGGIGVSPTRSEIGELDRFIDDLKAIDRGTALRESFEGKPVKWYHYWMFPDAIGRMHDQFDKVRRKQMRLVITEEGPKNMEVYEYNSTFSVVQKIMSKALDATDAVNAGVTQRVSDRFRFLHAADRTNAPRYYQAVVAKMEWDRMRNKTEASKAEKDLYEAEWNRHKEDYEELISKEFVTSLPGEGRRRVAGGDLANAVREKINEHTQEDYKRFIRNEEVEKEFLVETDNGGLDIDATLGKIGRFIEKTGEMPMFGMHGLNRIVYEIKLQNGPVPDIRRALTPFKGIGEIKFGYFPHMNWPKRAVENHLSRAIERAKLEGWDNADTVKLEARIRRQYGEGTMSDDDITDEIKDIILGGKGIVDSERTDPINMRPGSILGRSDEPIPQWDKSQKVLEIYGHKLSGAYHKMMGALMSDRAVKEFERRETFGDKTQAWSRFIRMYIDRSVGHSSIFPQEFIDDKDLSLSHRMVWPFMDHAAENLARRIDKKFGNRAFKGMFAKSRVGDAVSKRFQRKWANLSQLEGKWEMMSLLARTKSFVNNLSQSENTIISVGWDASRKAMSLRYLRDNILDEAGKPVFESWDDVRKFVESHGGIESFVIDEAGIRGRFDVPSVRAWIRESSDYLKKKWSQGIEGDDRDLKEIRNKYDISQNVVNAAGWFMRASERRVRMHSFMAHYIKAREALDANAFTYDKDHPWLIEMARRGTTATQFMYNNAFRPAFASSAFGKIASRFQLWAWNSVKFRTDVTRRANQFGMKQGTPEFDRFRRMAMLDTLMFSLASVFPASFFEATLPQPMGYVLDLSDYFFGQEIEDRESAFFGVLPYPFNITQAVTPPSFRLLTTVIKPLMTGDWSRYTSYHMWSLLPFGLALRDTKNTIQNPIRFVENTTGFPLARIHRELKSRTSGDTEIQSFFPMQLE